MITLKKLENGFEYLEVKNSFCSAKIALQGAHIFEYKRSSEEDILWLSEVSDFKLGKAIRGGVPICWPSFGMNNPNLAQHGFARTSLFKFVSSKEIEKDTTEVLLRLVHSSESLELWNYKFKLELKITLTDRLVMELITTNLDEKEFILTQALHTYFTISDISNIVVKGLENKPRFDALTGETFIQKRDIIFNEEFDSVFQKVDTQIVLEDKNRTINIKNEGSSSVVVWNPWIEKCSKMSAIKSNAYREFICIESANAYEDFRVLKPSQKCVLKVDISEFNSF